MLGDLLCPFRIQFLQLVLGRLRGWPQRHRFAFKVLGFAGRLNDIEQKVHGLLLGPGGANEGTNPVTLGRAIVVCNGVDKVLSETVPFDADGDARVKTTMTLPSPCLAPVIFFGSAGGSWFAVSG